ncbi:MAG: OmpA family protein, partial [Pseudomonadota bacterium]
DKLDAATLALEEALAEAEERLTLLAAADAAKERLEAAALEQSSAFDREAALRALAEQELSAAEAQTLEEQQRVALLTAEVQELQKQIAALERSLDASESQDAADQIQISQLGERLNAALARRVAVEAENAALEAENAALLAEQVDRLEQLRSIFLERVETALSGREGIRREGDRFVFQSEILFAPGSATLGPEGQAELTKLGRVVREVASDLPEDVNWILRIDGHTDRLPLSGQGRFANNWELSQARALSVVTYLISQQGVPPDRLAATGFGEYQPIAFGESPAALARNRRIEFKFTER